VGNDFPDLQLDFLVDVFAVSAVHIGESFEDNRTDRARDFFQKLFGLDQLVQFHARLSSLSRALKILRKSSIFFKRHVFSSYLKVFFIKVGQRFDFSGLY